jgi:hypothetical protein
LLKKKKKKKKEEEEEEEEPEKMGREDERGRVPESYLEWIYLCVRCSPGATRRFGVSRSPSGSLQEI